jgi:hypothetical protein
MKKQLLLLSVMLFGLLNANAQNATKSTWMNKLSTNHFSKPVQRTEVNQIYSDKHIIRDADLPSGKKLEKYGIADSTRCYLDYRICTRLYACMRLYYFHPSNEEPYKEKVKKLDELIKSEPFNSALKRVDMSLLSSSEKIFVRCVKIKAYRMLFLLVKLKSGRTRKKQG